MVPAMICDLEGREQKCVTSYYYILASIGAMLFSRIVRSASHIIR